MATDWLRELHQAENRLQALHFYLSGLERRFSAVGMDKLAAEAVQAAEIAYAAIENLKTGIGSVISENLANAQASENALLTNLIFVIGNLNEHDQDNTHPS